jgi:hypothetical protein
MSGYTPAFADMYMGTLFGRWPAAAVWATLLPLIDKQGRIDMSPQAISGMTGWPLELLELGIQQLMEPDPGSRTPDNEGRRLIPIDPTRPWGWIAVTHAKHRERARLMAKNERETESGANAKRMEDRRRPPETAGSDDGPPSTAGDPLSDTNTNPLGKNARKRASRLPEDFQPNLETALSEIPDLDAETEFARFRDYWRAKPGSGGTKADWPATWRNWIRTCKTNGKYARRKQARTAEFVC